MQTLTVDILNNKAVKLLQDLEQLQLIRVRLEKQKSTYANNTNRIAKYKGTMIKQPLNEVDNQLNELRNEWE